MAITENARRELRTLYNALSDQVLMPGDPRYVAAVNCPSDNNTVERLLNELTWQDSEQSVCYFTGQRGTGKSTELRRLQWLLTKEGYRAFYVDIAEYLLPTQPVGIMEFLIMMAGAVSDAIHNNYGKSITNQSYWERLTEFLQSKVEIKDLNFKLDAIELKGALKSDPVLKSRIIEEYRKYLPQIIKEVHCFISEAIDFAARNEQKTGARFALLVDSVERIRGTGQQAADVYQSMRNLFYLHQDNLRLPRLHTVYTIPPFLSGLMPGAVPNRLTSVHVFRYRSDEPDPEGLDTMRKIIEMRYAAWPQIISEKALTRLAIVSGGDIREFFRLIRLLLPSVRDDSDLPLPLSATSQAENAARGEMLPIMRLGARCFQFLKSTSYN